MIQKPKSARRGRTAIEPNRLGDLAEMWVGFLATWKGAEVFPNLNKTGPADLLIKIDDIVYAIDVKSDCWCNQRNIWRAANTYKVKDPVFPVAVTPEGDICNWKVRWIKNRAPKGLENFWSKEHTS